MEKELKKIYKEITELKTLISQLIYLIIQPEQEGEATEGKNELQLPKLVKQSLQENKFLGYIA